MHLQNMVLDMISIILPSFLEAVLYFFRSSRGKSWINNLSVQPTTCSLIL